MDTSAPLGECTQFTPLGAFSQRNEPSHQRSGAHGPPNVRDKASSAASAPHGPLPHRAMCRDSGASLAFPIGPLGGVTSPLCSYPPARPRTLELGLRAPQPDPGQLTHPAGATGLSERGKQSRKEPQATANKLRPAKDPCSCLRSASSEAGAPCLRTASLHHFPESVSYLFCVKFSVT